MHKKTVGADLPFFSNVENLMQTGCGTEISFCMSVSFPVDSISSIYNQIT